MNIYTGRWLGLFFSLSLLIPASLFGLGFEINFHNALEYGWYKAGDDETSLARYIFQPKIDISQDLGGDISTSLNLIPSLNFRFTDDPKIDLDIHRCWVNLASDNAEFRLGLQKLSFGTATILRPLNWFDNVDPLDITDQSIGVKAALLRYGFGPHTQAWAWAELGDGEFINHVAPSTPDGEIGLGGRLEGKLLDLNYGLTTFFTQLGYPGISDDRRFGLDIRYDGAVGVWLESSFIFYTLPLLDYRDLDDYQKRLDATLGIDYTIPVANGIYILGEYGYQYWFGSAITGGDYADHYHNGAMLISYPLGLLDKLTAVGTLKESIFDDDEYKCTLAWQRQYDYLSFSLSVFNARNWRATTNGAMLQLNYDF